MVGAWGIGMEKFAIMDAVEKEEQRSPHRHSLFGPLVFQQYCFLLARKLYIFNSKVLLSVWTYSWMLLSMIDEYGYFDTEKIVLFLITKHVHGYNALWDRTSRRVDEAVYTSVNPTVFKILTISLLSGSIFSNDIMESSLQCVGNYVVWKHFRKFGYDRNLSW